MEKITSFMRVTKQRKAHGKQAEASPSTKKARLAIDQSATRVAKAETDDEASEGDYAPTFIYEAVKYVHKRQPHEVSKEMRAVVAYIQKHYDIPRDFERSHKFGPHSGLTYERRLTRAYSLRQLPLKRRGHGQASVTAPAPICLACAVVGHSYKACPDGF